MSFTDYYALLGVDRNSTDEAIREAYEEKQRFYNPEFHDNTEEENSMFKALVDAYYVLSDPKKKQAYDRDYDGMNETGTRQTGQHGYEKKRAGAGKAILVIIVLIVIAVIVYTTCSRSSHRTSTISPPAYDPRTDTTKK
jgi:DnaJ-class molecular chaperone